MSPPRKITIQISDDLLKNAQEVTGKGITATIRQGLELVAAAKTYEHLRQLRGKIKFSIDVGSLRQDRNS